MGKNKSKNQNVKKLRREFLYIKKMREKGICLSYLGDSQQPDYFLSIFNAYQFGDRKQEAVESSRKLISLFSITISLLRKGLR